MLDLQRLRSAKVRVLLVIIGLATCMTVYRFLMDYGLGYSSALFVGLPAILAVVVTLSPPAKSLTGSVMRAITLLLLLAGIMGVEGFVCIVMVSPLFYFVGWAVAYPIERYRRRNLEDGSKSYLMIGLPFLLMMFEGTMPATTFDREQSVSSSRQVDASPDQVAAALSAAPRFDEPLPPFLRLGFPTPAGGTGTGLNVGAVRSVLFAECHHPESRTTRPVNARLTLRVEESEPGRVVFGTVRDTTLQGRWAQLTSSEVEWKATGDGGTRVTWTLNYDRRLDPAFYFGPLQRYGMGVTAQYLIEALATPK
jgi:hypothetical protein